MALNARALQDAQAWSADHDVSRAWYEVLGLIGPWVLLALLGALLGRALLRARRYRAASVLPEAERAEVVAALRAAEARTRGELVPVVVERSDAHVDACWRAALVALAVGTALLVPRLPWDQPWLFLLCQAGLAAAGYLAALWLPDFARAFVPERRATAVAEEQAVQEFHRQGLSRTEGQTGVLLFVSLLEHRAVVLADRGIDTAVAGDAWASVDRAILAGLRRGSLREGLVEGIRLAGELLARHVPAAEGRDPNELPDRLVVRRE